MAKTRPDDDISSLSILSSRNSVDAETDFPLKSLKRGQEPIATVQPNDPVRFILTADAYASMSDDALERNEVDFSTANRLVGPIAVAGAEPGDALGFSITQIDLADHGYALYIAKWSERHIPDMPSSIRRYPIVDDRIVLDANRSIHVAPMIGWLGNTPGRGSLPSLSPTGRTGGNLDLQQACRGATVWLPVEVAGAGFAVGDLHARMGAGEPMLAGIECGGAIDARFRLQRRCALTGPRIEHHDRITFVGCHLNDPDRAESIAIGAAWRWLTDECSLDANDAKAIAASSLDLGYGGPAGNNRTASFDLVLLRDAGIEPRLIIDRCEAVSGERAV